MEEKTIFNEFVDYNFLTEEEFLKKFEEKNFICLVKAKLFKTNDYEGFERNVYLELKTEIEKEIESCIFFALTYHCSYAKSYKLEILPIKMFTLS